MASPSIIWDAPDKFTEPHGPDWYWAVGIIALSIMATSIILRNILFAVFIVLATIVLFLRSLQKPRLVHYELTTRGLRTDKSFESYSQFQSFWVDDNERLPKLLLTGKSFLTPLSVIPLVEVDPDDVREFLLEFVPEVETHEPISRLIMEYLGF